MSNVTSKDPRTNSKRAGLTMSLLFFKRINFVKKKTLILSKVINFIRSGVLSMKMEGKKFLTQIRRKFRGHRDRRGRFSCKIVQDTRTISRVVRNELKWWIVLYGCEEHSANRSASRQIAREAIEGIAKSATVGATAAMPCTLPKCIRSSAIDIDV